MQIRVAMIARSTLYTIPGGDTVQVVETARHLAKLGVQVDIKLTDALIDYSQYDLLHFFNIIRPADILYHIRKSNKPFAISTIFIDYSEYDKWHRDGFAGMLFRSFTSNAIEYIKTVTRWLLGRDRLMSTSYLWKGQHRSIKEVLQKAGVLLPNSNHEYERLLKQYLADTPCWVVPNGIDPAVFQFDPLVEKDSRMIICAARIEGIKNQLNLIKALNKTRFELYLIGSPAPNQLSYYQACKNMAAANIHFIEHLPQEELLKYYQKAAVHVLPSWFETTGLSSLEAAAMGCNIVITDKGDAKEYLGREAFYCNPSSPVSIYTAIEKAAEAPVDPALRQRVLEQYTWQKAAAETLKGYKRMITEE